MKVGTTRAHGTSSIVVDLLLACTFLLPMTLGGSTISVTQTLEEDWWLISDNPRPKKVCCNMSTLCCPFLHPKPSTVSDV